MENKPKLAIVKVIKEGPLKVTGNFKITDMAGKELEKTGVDVYICRCGKSGNMPFCDGTHKSIALPYD